MRNPKLFFAVLLSLALAPGLLHAQATGSVRGTVTELATERPLSGVQVFIPGSSVGTLTDANGRFLLVNVPVGTHTVRATLIGYGQAEGSVEVQSGQTAQLNLRLESAAIAMQEIVVTGVSGATVQAKVPFDIASVRSEDLVVPSTSPASAIQGKVAGAQVVSGSGRPGAAPSIMLRGATSINASGRSQEPLYIVDGVILGGSMVDITSLDIESIEVIKGAAAASLYGSRAANGVVSIQTRRGASVPDDQIRYTVRTQYGENSMPNTPDVLVGKLHPFRMDGNSFVQNNGQLCEDYLTCASVIYAGQTRKQEVDTNGNPVFNPDGTPKLVAANAWNTYQRNSYPQGTYDQVGLLFQNGQFFENYVSAEGRAGATNFHVSYSNLRDRGIMPGLDGLNRHSFRVNLDQNVVEQLQLSASAYYGLSGSDVFPESQSNPMFRLTRTRAGVNLWACESDPTQDCRNNPQDIILQADPFNTEAENPLNSLLNRNYTENRGRFLGSVNARYTPVAWFSLDGDASFDRLDTEEEDLYPKGYRTVVPSSTTNGGYLDRYLFNQQAINTSVTGTFRFNLADGVNNRTQFRYLYEQQDRDWTFTSGYRFAVANTPVFGNVDPETLGASSNTQSIRADGYFAITNFDIFDRYIIDALVRNDGSSLFGADERRQWYYRLAGAWRVGQEPWFNVPAVDELKLRYAYGTAGGRPSFAAQYETFSVSSGSVTPITLGNNALKPEFSAEHEAGVDASFLNGRFGVGLTYANTTTTDQILLVPLPAYGGYSNQWQNAGTLQSKAFEASFDARLVQSSDFQWSARVLFDRTRSTITELDAPPFLYGVAGQNLGNVFYARAGEEMGTFYGTLAASECSHLPSGMDCSNFAVNDDGFLVWVGNGTLADNSWGTSSGLTIQGVPVMWGAPIQGQCVDRVTGERTYTCPVGNSMPDYNVGFSSTMNWRGFSLYGLVDASQGFDVYNQPLQWAIFAETAGLFDQTGPESQQKPIGYYSAMYGNLGGLKPSSAFVEDGSFVKLRELALRYRMDPTTLGAIPGLNNFSGLTFSLTGRNLKTWTDYRGFDPEVGKAGGDTGSAALARVEGFQYPNFRTWTLGLELNF